MTQDEYESLLRLLDDRYVLSTSCNERQEKVNNRFANDDARIKLFEQKIKSWEWMFRLIATGVIGTFVASILNLICK